MNPEKVHLGQNAVQHVARARLGSGVGGLSELQVVHLARYEVAGVFRELIDERQDVGTL